MKRRPQPQPRSPEWAKIVRENPSKYPTLVRALAATTLHKAGLYHDRTICQACARESKEATL